MINIVFIISLLLVFLLFHLFPFLFKLFSNFFCMFRTFFSLSCIFPTFFAPFPSPFFFFFWLVQVRLMSYGLHHPQIVVSASNENHGCYIFSTNENQGKPWMKPRMKCKLPASAILILSEKNESACCFLLVLKF